MEVQKKQDCEYIALLENKVENHQRLASKCNIEIKNITLKKQETKQDLCNMVYQLGENLNMKVESRDIKDIIKVKSRNEKHTIIVEFNNTFIKNNILKSAKIYNTKNKYNKLSGKHLGIKSNPDDPIFLAENLSPQSSRLFYLARELKKSKEYKYCWSNYGKIYLRHDDNSPIINITNAEQVQKLMCA